MTGNVYSTYELAFERSLEKMHELEEDIFICKCEYRSGTEFVLKTRRDLINNGHFIYQRKLPFGHHFKIKENAIREANRFQEVMGKPIVIQKHTFTEKGYTKTSHYTLCST